MDSSEGADDSTSGSSSSQWVILALSLLVTTVVGYVNFMNPAQRWQQLRGILQQYNFAIMTVFSSLLGYC